LRNKRQEFKLKLAFATAKQQSSHMKKLALHWQILIGMTAGILWGRLIEYRLGSGRSSCKPSSEQIMIILLQMARW
jgi:Na+/H+-dicarboxylate symporter